MKNIFIIGSKGIPAMYGGFETFVEELTKNKISEEIKYHVACISNNNQEFEHNGARCFNVKVPNIGPAKAVYYDLKALKICINYIKKNRLENPIIYILACRIGPFIKHYKRKMRKLGISLYVNPDGHEWKRAKWNWLIRQYWKISERYMVKHADLLICDSINIEQYIKDEYNVYKPQTAFIAYGAYVPDSINVNKKYTEWCKEKGITKEGYYLVVGRFVPENNYEIMLKEYLKSKTKKNFVLITNVEKNKFYDELKNKTNFDKDARIKFVGTVYDQELLTIIRQNAYGYIHGHEVGGTNPSLLEALATTKLNLLLDVGFNREVADNSALYFTKESGNLKNIIDECDIMSEKNITELAKKAKYRIAKLYSWEKIVNDYETLFTTENK